MVGITASEALKAAACLDWTAQDNRRAAALVPEGPYKTDLLETAKEFSRIAEKIRKEVLTGN